MTLRRLMERYCDEDEHPSTFLKTDQTADNFHRLGKNVSFRQRLNNFIRIGDNSGIRFLDRITGILSGSVAFVESGFLMRL